MTDWPDGRAGRAAQPFGPAPARPSADPIGLAWFALGLGGLTALVVGTGAPVWLRLTLVVAFLCLGVGSAILCQLPRLDHVTTIALTVIGSLAGFVIAGTVPLWVHRWAPGAVVGWLALACAVSGLVALARHAPTVGRQLRARLPSGDTLSYPFDQPPGSTFGQPPGAAFGPPPGSSLGSVPGSTFGQPAGASFGRARPALAARGSVAPAQRTGLEADAGGGPGAPRWRQLLDVGLLLLAFVAWAFALGHTDVHDVGGFGLLSVVNPVFFVAPAVCLIGFVAELSRASRPRSGHRGPIRTVRGTVLAAYTLMLMLVIHASTPLLLSQPQYAWTYKHIGVIDFFAGHGTVTSGGDIYQQWPAFFAAAAQLGGAGGVSALGLAPWAPLFFNVVGSVLLFAIARTLSPDRRVAFATVLLFQCINWIEEDYLSPQGLAFVLSLAIYFLVLRFLRVDPAAATGSGRLARLANFLHRGLAPVPPVSRSGTSADSAVKSASSVRLAAVGAVAVVMAVLTASHQLSPYLVAISVVGLVVLGLVRPWWVALVMVAIPVAYLVPRYEFVSDSFGLFDGMNLFHNAGGNADAWGTVGQAFSAVTVRALALAVWLVLAVAAWRVRREPGRLLVPVVLALIPFGLIVVQSYGGEAIYRVFLFSAPWCAYVIAQFGAELRWPRRVKEIVAVVALAAAFVGTMQGRHGQLLVDQHSSAEVTAAEYLYAHAEPGATIVLAAPNFPSRIAPNYGEFNRTVAVGEPDLVKGAGLRKVTFYPEYLTQIEQFAGTFNGTTAYLVVSDEMANYAKFFGYLPDGAVDNLRDSLRAAPEWTLFYRNDDVVIYQLRQ